VLAMQSLVLLGDDELQPHEQSTLDGAAEE
jgi:hypothetical protein